LFSSVARSIGAGSISGNGLSKLFLTNAAAFAEAERDRIRERAGRSRLTRRRGTGDRRGERGGLTPHEAAEQAAIREMVARDEGKPLRA
jgi:putative DNA-invertase from lambdoid prophage Rac